MAFHVHMMVLNVFVKAELCLVENSWASVAFLAVTLQIYEQWNASEGNASRFAYICLLGKIK